MLTKKNICITYIFNEGKKNIIENPEFSKEFIYFYDFMKSEFTDINFIELNGQHKSFFTKILRLLEKFLYKFYRVPFFGHKILDLKNFKRLLNSDHIIISTENIGFSLTLPLNFIKLIKKPKVSILIMGVSNFVNVSRSRNFINRMFNISDNLIFLSTGEKEKISKLFTRHSHKMYYLPFSIDPNFWKKDFHPSSEKEFILFNGNDHQRDYVFLDKLIFNLPDYKFLIVSNSFKTKNRNVKVISTDIRNPQITDKMLREIYSMSYLSLIPLKNTHQPSGQSVAIQSMAMEVPVIITETNGFWEKSLFENNKNIFFLRSNMKEWVNLINDLDKNKYKINKVSKNARKTIEENYSNTKVYKKFLEILQLDK